MVEGPAEEKKRNHRQPFQRGDCWSRSAYAEHEKVGEEKVDPPGGDFNQLEHKIRYTRNLKKSQLKNSSTRNRAIHYNEAMNLA